MFSKFHEKINPISAPPQTIHRENNMILTIGKGWRLEEALFVNELTSKQS